MNSIWLLAIADNGELESTELTHTSTDGIATQETIAVDGTNGDLPQQPQGRPASPMMTYMMFGMLFIVMYFMFFRGPKKKRQQHESMVKSLTKNDKIHTIGGIIATVIDVRDEEITIKIDESNNTKMKITPGAVRTVLTAEKD